MAAPVAPIQTAGQTEGCRRSGAAMAALGQHVLACLAAAMLAGCAGPPTHDAPADAGSTVADASHAPARAGSSGADVVMTAMLYRGVAYRRGGSDAAEGFDCSGFARHVYEESLGVQLPRQSHEQAAAPGLLPVERGELRPGDLVFFNTLRRRYSHVGIYIGEERFIHAPRTGARVRIEDMRLPYWQRRYDGARRAAHGGPGATPTPDEPWAGAPGQ